MFCCREFDDHEHHRPEGARLGSSRAKTAELVASELRRRIVHGELREGDNLPSEPALIEEFGISRPTMREAFRILETERLISVSRGSRGVARIHLPEVDVVSRYAGLYLQWRNIRVGDVIEARKLIEPAAAARFAERRPPALIAELKAMLAEVEEHVEDAQAYSHHAAAFHLKVIEGSGNETLALIGRVTQQVMEAYLLNVTGKGYVVELAKKGLRSEKKLLCLIEAGDARGAEAQVKRHLENAYDILKKTLGAESVVEVLG